jgi:3-carboxy-cis,cis-muconate cycloisomerase
MGMDISLMTQQGVDEMRLRGGGASSAMPHKQNPILAELLVTLSRANAVQLGGMHQALIHEQERSGASWALEWIILPAMLHKSCWPKLKPLALESRCLWRDDRRGV